MRTPHQLIPVLFLASVSACDPQTLLGESEEAFPTATIFQASDLPPTPVDSSEPGEGMNGPVLGMKCKVTPNAGTGTVLSSGKLATNVELNTTNITGMADGKLISGNDFVNAQLPATLNGMPTTVLIKTYDPSGRARVNPDIHYYHVQVKKDGLYKDLCKENLAIAVAGTWNEKGAFVPPGYGTSYDFTFACTGSAIAKCIDQTGTQYKPWSSTLERDRLVACTRMMRADYCGNGEPHTNPGLWITFKDKANHRAYVSAGPPSGGALIWRFEAVWSTAGAECVFNPRVSGFTSCPDGRNLIRNDCQTAIPWTSALIKNQSNASWMRVDPEPPCPGCTPGRFCPICNLE